MPPKKTAASPTRKSNGAHASTSGVARPAAKRPATARGYKRPEPLPEGFLVEDKLSKKEWRVGPVVGQGGFADVYLVSDKTTRTVTESTAKHVLKVEPSDNGPLYQEVKFFKACAKKETIAAFLRDRNIKSLGMMEYVASGVMETNDKELRWLILPRLGQNVQQILEEHKTFSRSCVILLALQLIDILEYIHNQGYAHADLKATNLMTGLAKTDASQVYLIDFGLVKRFMDDSGKHIPYREEPKAAHDGTLELTSVDAHKGAAPSRRGDLQILGFNLIKWIVGVLPWTDSSDANFVRSQKVTYFQNLSEFFRVAFPAGDTAPKEIMDYFKAVRDLGYDEKPNYTKLRDIFQKASKDTKVRKSDLFAPAQEGVASTSNEEVDAPTTTRKRTTKSAAVPNGAPADPAPKRVLRSRKEL